MQQFLNVFAIKKEENPIVSWELTVMNINKLYRYLHDYLTAFIENQSKAYYLNRVDDVYEWA